MDELAKRKKVCVIGAGAAGLCATKHFARSSKFVVKVYEQAEDVGGTWVYKEETGDNENGLPVHSSIYRNLRTNLPARIMNFPDYLTLNAEEPCCVTHQEVRTYLENYAKHFDLVKYIQVDENPCGYCTTEVRNGLQGVMLQFGAKVESVRSEMSSEGVEKWIVRVKMLKTGQEEEAVFNAVIICNGHFFDPYVPTIPGIDTFPGITTHSHSYRKPEDFSGKSILLLGASSSGIDIALDLVNHATRVYLSHNNERLDSALHSNIVEVLGVERVEGERIILKDQSSVTVDVFMFCTGYRYSFPFLNENCGIRVDDNYVTPLYKHVINIHRSTMCIVGVPFTVVPFPMFHVQVQYFLALLEERASLPSKSVMLDDSMLQTANKRHAHKLADRQWEYYDSLANAGGFDRLPKFYKLGYEAWSAQRKNNLSRYKEAKFVISEDGRTIELIIQS